MSTKKDKFSSKDKFYMELALDLAKSRHGQTGSNPSVGCVIVKNDKIISIGQTSFNGRPHAEFNAIKNSFEELEGSKMYVTLEPCCHHGLTPPCTDAIIKSRISEVIYAVTDIDKRVRNKSFKILKSKKIIVKKGLLKSKIESFYLPYFFNRKKKLPFVTGKIAISKNNIIYSKNQKKITNSYSDQFTHLLRYQNDSLMITYKTLNKEFIDMVNGKYGKIPGDICPKLKKKIDKASKNIDIDDDVQNLEFYKNEFKEFCSDNQLKKISKNPTDLLNFILFPKEAKDFYLHKNKSTLNDIIGLQEGFGLYVE